MKKGQTIKKILALGLKEYKTSEIEHYERAWQKEINDDLSVNVNFWEHSKYDKINKFVKDSFEIEIYCNNDDGAERILIYGFNDFDKAYKKAMLYIKLLENKND